ncbi:MAG: PAS domain-containing protein [Alphaproteobacteria bacterium]
MSWVGGPDITPEELSAQHERLVQLHAFWDVRRGMRRLPARSDFDAVEFRPWMGHLVLIEVCDGPAFRYRVYGSVLAETFGRDLTGKTTAALRPDARQTVEREYAAVCERRQPLLISHWRTGIRGYARFSKLVLPFAEDGETVDRLLVGAYRVGRVQDGAEPPLRQAFIQLAPSRS